MLSIWIPTIRTGTGAEVYARRLARGLTQRGHEVRLDLVAHSFQYAPWLAPIRPPRNCDVTVANSWSAVAFAGRSALVTIVHHVVGDPALAPFKSGAQRLFHRGFVLPMERAALARSSAVVAVSETTAAAVRSHLGFANVTPILNGVDTSFFTPAEELAAREDLATVKLLFVGKPSRRKAFDLISQLVQAMGDRCRFTCIGEAPEPGLQLPEGNYRGRVSAEDLRQAYWDADFVLMPSRLEGFGYAAAEALACGTPVICVAGGAVAEIAQPPRGALTVTDDIAQSAAAILARAADRAGHSAMRRTARQIALDTLGETRWLDQMESLLIDVAASHSGGARRNAAQRSDSLAGSR